MEYTVQVTLNEQEILEIKLHESSNDLDDVRLLAYIKAGGLIPNKDWNRATLNHWLLERCKILSPDSEVTFADLYVGETFKLLYYYDSIYVKTLIADIEQNVLHFHNDNFGISYIKNPNKDNKEPINAVEINGFGAMLFCEPEAKVIRVYVDERKLEPLS